MEKIWVQIGLAIIGCMLIRWLIKKIREVFYAASSKALPAEIKISADRNFNIAIKRFQELHGRKPNKNEKIGIAVKISHYITRRDGWEGHWTRQKIRKYLLEKNKVVGKFMMR
jgi:hypothetical protein